MADDTTTPSPAGTGRRESPDRGGRSGPNREPGGFRIRLSDNEMQAARALQEAFGLRSTVAVLGFALRTLAEQLEKGQLEALVAEHRAQAGSRPAPQRRGGGDAPSRGGGRGAPVAARVDPFARPSRPVVTPPAESAAAAPSELPADAAAEAQGESPAASEEVAGVEAETDAVAAAEPVAADA